MFYYDTPKTPDGLKIEISYKKGNTSYIRQVFIPYSELVTEQNQEFWQDYLYEKIPGLVDEGALNSPDEHYNYFDDMYSPDYECTELYKLIVQQLQLHPDAEAEELLKLGLAEIRQMEAFTSYGYPSLCFE